MHEWRDGVHALRNVFALLVSCDPPQVSGSIFDTCFAVTVGLIDWLFDRGGSGFEGAAVGCVGVFDIDVQRSRNRIATPGVLRAASADHQHGIAHADFRVDATCRSSRPECFLTSESALDKVILFRHMRAYEIGSHGVIALRNWAYARSFGFDGRL